MQPSNADALPARAPCPLMAQAEVFGKMQPRLAMQINSGTSNGHSASVRNAAIPNSVNAAATYTHTVRDSKNAGPRLASNLAFSCATRIKPAALEPNNQP